jgi:hypothetical protein
MSPITSVSCISCQGKRWEENEWSLADSEVEREHRSVRHFNVLEGNISRQALAHKRAEIDPAANIGTILSVTRP